MSTCNVFENIVVVGGVVVLGCVQDESEFCEGADCNNPLVKKECCLTCSCQDKSPYCKQDYYYSRYSCDEALRTRCCKTCRGKILIYVFIDILSSLHILLKAIQFSIQNLSLKLLPYSL